MALERFIPKSPDPFIRNSQDFEVAKFGHLNTIIEYVNSYVVTDSLQLAGSGPITSTARYITDSLGNNSAISIGTTRVGIGTDTPSAELHIDGHNGFGASLKITTNKVNSVAYVQMISDYVTGFEQNQYGGPGWGWPNWTTTRAGGTAAAPTTVTSNYGLNEYSFWGHDGTSVGQAYSMMTRTSETWTPTAHGIYTVFNTVATGSTSLVERMRFTGTGNITFNNASDTAKVAIKGSGSTSATTSFLVQNSAGTAALTVRDDLYVFGGSRVYSTGNMYMDGNSGTLFSAWGQLQLQGASYVQIMNDTLRAGSQNFTFQNTSFSPNNVTNSNLRLVGNSAGFTNGGAGGTSVGNVLEIPIDIATSVGNVTLNHININGVINTTAGTTLQRGFYYNPTLTGTVGFTHRAIETVTGNVLLGTTSGNVLLGTSTDNGYKLDVNGISYNTFTTNTPSLVDTSANNYRIANLLKYNPYSPGAFANNTLDLFSVGANTTSSSASNGNPFFRVNLAGGNSTGYYGSAGTNNSLAQLNSVTTSTFVASAQGGGIAVIGSTGTATVTTISQGINLNLRSDVNGSYAGGGINYYASINGSQHSHVWYFNSAEQMRLIYTGNLLIGTNSDLARLTVKGSGATSATTSLLVQNSNNTEAFRILDNLTVVCSGLLNVTSAITSTFLSGGGTAFTIVDDNGTFVRNSTWNFNRTSLNAWIGGSEQISSLFTLNSTTKGFSPPRMTTAQKLAIVTPNAGLVVYDTDLNKLCVYTTAWQTITSV